MKITNISTLSLRLALAAGFLSAVESRLSLWGRQSSGWTNFLGYAAQVNSFLPKRFIPAIAVTSTILETSLGILLLFGYKTKLAAFGAALLTILFAFAMGCSFGIKEPLDYSVFAFSAGAFLLAGMPYYKWSIDQLIKNKTHTNGKIYEHKHERLRRKEQQKNLAAFVRKRYSLQGDICNTASL